MSEVYASIDLGTNSVKIIVSEKVNNEFHILASVSEKSKGIVNGQVEDIKSAVVSVKGAVKKINEMLGIKITKVIVSLAPVNCKMDIAVGSFDVLNEKITGADIISVLKDALVGRVTEDEELVTSIPISFTVDDKENIKDPRGMVGERIDVKAVITTLPKEPLYRILEVLKLSGLETVDIAFTSTGDYYTVKNKLLDSKVGAIINIGEDSTNIAVFNKGIQIKNAIIPIGSVNVDKDISYIFKTTLEESRKIKESFAVSMEEYADSNDLYEIKFSDGTTKEISQVGVSKVVEARVDEILKLAKNELKNLTKREISYIIVTGGLSEIAGFQYIVESKLGINAKVCNITTMGIRHNKYSSAMGIIKYFDDKLNLRDKSYTMIRKEDIESLISTEQKINNNDNIISKVFGHFFDN